MFFIKKKQFSNNKTNTNYKPTPEQVKLYNQRAYLQRMEKMKKEMEEKQKDENI